MFYDNVQFASLISKFCKVKKNKYFGLIIPKKYGGKFLVRGGKKIVTEGREFMRTAVIEFTSFDKAKEFYYSREYQAAHGLLKDTVIRSHQIIEGT